MDELANLDLPTRIRRLRQTLGLTQIDFAQRLGVSNVTVNRWEHGRTAPGSSALARLRELESRSASTRTSTHAEPAPIPVPASEFVGRREDVATLSSALIASRLVTLVGPGGVGKTRLASEVARLVTDHFPDGACWVDLASLVDPAIVPETVARALGLPVPADQLTTARLVNWNRTRRLLIIFDNCEHLLAGVARIAQALLEGCPGIRLLATSRAPLEVPGEQIWPVAPLSLPEVTGTDDPFAILAAEAGRLFVERARSRNPSFTLTPRNATAVAEICQRLDGLPLALELAAARTSLLGPAEIASRLDDRFRLLRTEAAVVVPRHRALETTLDWSFDLLSPPDRSLFARLSVFAGGFDLDAAEAVGAADDTITSLSRLVAQSLVETRSSHGSGRTRYRLLESIRAYSAERLISSGDAEQTRQLHAAYYTQLAERGSPALDGPDQIDWFDRLDDERDNLRAALSWYDTHGRPGSLLQLASALWRFWWVRASLGEGRRWLTAGLLVGGSVPPKVRARALTAAGILAREQSDLAAARELLETGLTTWREVDDPEGLTLGLVSLALAALDSGDFDAAELGYREALALARSRHDEQQVALRTFNLAAVALARDDIVRAMGLLSESLPVLHRYDHRFGVAIATFATGVIAARSDEIDLAEQRYQEAVTRFQELGYPDGIALALNGLGHCRLTQGDLDAAATFFIDALTLWQTHGLRHRIGHGIRSAALLALERGQLQLAARIAGAAVVIGGEVSPLYFPIRSKSYSAAIESLRHRLGTHAFATVWAEGSTLAVDDVIASLHSTPLTLPVSASPLAPSPDDRSPVSAHLSPRVAEVLHLVANGHTNAEIAVTLGITARTVEQHLTSAYAVLGARGRADAVARAIASGVIQPFNITHLP